MVVLPVLHVLPVLLVLYTASATSASASSASATSASPRPPNLLFAMADQLRWDAQSYANPQSAVRTPALDRIAAEGVHVRFAWSSTPTCTPARAALLTGRRPWGHGMLGYGAIAERYPLVFPRLLRDAGYQTVSLGKDHFGWNVSSDSGISHGYQKTVLYDGLGQWQPDAPNHWDGEYDDYDRWFARQMPGADPAATLDGHDGDGWNGWHGKAFVYEERLHPTAWLGSQAVAFLESYDPAVSPPFLLKVSFHRPHSPYDPPKRWLDQVDASALAPMARCAAVDAAADDAANAADGCWSTRFRGNASAGDPPGCEVTDNAWCGVMPEPAATLGRRAYLASVGFVDEQMGRLYAALQTSGLLASTLLLWTADHGDGQGDHHHWRKGFPYEFSAHVPLLLRWPEGWETPWAVRLARGSVIEPPLVAELRDIFHTLVDAAGAAGAAASHGPAFDANDGKSLLCLLRDPSGRACDYAPNPGPWRTIIDLEHSTCYNMTNHCAPPAYARFPLPPPQAPSPPPSTPAPPARGPAASPAAAAARPRHRLGHLRHPAWALSAASPSPPPPLVSPGERLLSAPLSAATLTSACACALRPPHVPAPRLLR